MPTINNSIFKQCGVALLCLLVMVPARAAEQSLLTKGEQVYNKNCVFCHQADAIGKPGLAPSLTNKELLANVSDEFLIDAIRDGRLGTSMMPFAHLKEEHIKAVVAYLRSHEKLPNKSAAVNAHPEALVCPRLPRCRAAARRC